MRATRIYVGVIGLLAAWVVSTKALSSWTTSLPLDQRAPTAGEAILVGAGLWSIRAMPFVVVAAVLAVPVLIPVFAWLVREHPFGIRMNVEPLMWFGIGVLSWAAAVLAAWREWPPSVGLLLFWSGALGYSLSLALAYRVHKRLHVRGDTGVPAGAFLVASVAIAVAAPWACIFAVCFPSWVEWRRPTSG